MKVNRLRNSILNSYSQANELIVQIIPLIDSLVKQDTLSFSASTEPSLPSADEVERMRSDFFGREMHCRSAPIPNWSGCYAAKMPNVKYGMFVCARSSGTYMLMIVLQEFADKLISAFDPTEVKDGIKVVELPKSEWTPLPTVFPENPTKRWEHARGTTILSLFPLDDGEWTTVFYEAVVKQQPSERTDDKRLYSLLFDDGSQADVGEQFVVGILDEWKR
jgi:hypothetical protein